MRVQHLVSLLLLLLAPAIQAAVLAIDYGAEFTKLSLVKPGVPFDVVLDKDSKRKIQSVVGWKREDRVFGAEAKMAATRFPDTHFPYVKPLLGSTALSPLPVYPNPPSITPDNTLVFPHPSPPSHLSPSPSSQDEVWTPTALLAHQISYFRHLAESLSGTSTPEPINQVIVTVPAWWDHFQRKAYRDALELQGLSCLAMIGEGTGVALNYAMTRTFPTFNLETGEGEKEYHIIYDSGALSTTATVLAFYQTSVLPFPKSKSPVNTTHIEVLGTGWENVGGVILDVALQEILTADFVGKTGQEGIVGDKRALAKLVREANRVKHILSANQEATVAIESLYNDVDYRSRLSRAALESALEETAPLFSLPLTAALASANLTLSDITSVILFGGNTRVPLVQSAIKSVLGHAEDRIAQNVNTDEAAVLGAAYYGAALSRQFKMKNLNVTEKSVSDIIMGEEVIFPKGSKLGDRQSIALPADKGEVVLEFAQSQHTSAGASLSKQEIDAKSRPILSVQILDIDKALANFTSPSPIVNLTMRLDPRGILHASNAVLSSSVIESKEGGVAGALKGFFGGKKEETAEEGSEKAETENNKSQKVALKFREKQLGVKTMSGEEKRTTLARLNSIASFEASKAAREEARNSLEGYLYRLSGFLSADADNKAVQEYSTKEEQKTLKALVDETFEWLGEHAESAEEKLLRAKRAALEKLEAPIIFRFTEDHKRGKAVEDFQQAMFASRAFLVEARKNNTAALEEAATATPENPAIPPKYTEEELKNVEDMMKANEVWMDEKMKVQVTLEDDRTKDPVIVSGDLDERGKNLQSTVLKLVNKKAPRRPRPSPSATTSTAPSLPTDHGPEVPESTHDTDLEWNTATTSTTLASPTDHGPDPPTQSVPSHEEL
ncbi:hypothetical protein IAR55_000221 [Kwoniella newhampshirensis]|uniref:Hypoxia up-regulated 1 n=1 Tax=Kwoniella newhampshirensis TaxID=1651941 RepID=A0AAW0Z644_9TREE